MPADSSKAKGKSRQHTPFRARVLAFFGFLRRSAGLTLVGLGGTRRGIPFFVRNACGPPAEAFERGGPGPAERRRTFSRGYSLEASECGSARTGAAVAARRPGFGPGFGFAERRRPFSAATIDSTSALAVARSPRR